MRDLFAPWSDHVVVNALKLLAKQVGKEESSEVTIVNWRRMQGWQIVSRRKQRPRDSLRSIVAPPARMDLSLVSAGPRLVRVV